MLINNTHIGNSSEAQSKKLMLNNKNNASPIPRYAIQRGIIPVRIDRVLVEIMNTPAIFIVYTVIIIKTIVRPRAYVPELIKLSGLMPYKLITLPATPEEVNSIAKNKSPLPRKTVEKNRSSDDPKRSRITPINHKKAIPENGIRFKARLTLAELSASQFPSACGLAGTESFIRTRLINSKTENRIPAIAAARGVVRLARGCMSSLINDFLAFHTVGVSTLKRPPPTNHTLLPCHGNSQAFLWINKMVMIIFAYV